MELETEIPIWFNGKIKWISNLTSRSKCSDIIEAILSSIDKDLSLKNEDYILYESWRGVERALKARCRLLKLWKSWSNENENVILTLRSSKEEKIPIYYFIQKQNIKLNKLKNQIKNINKNISKLNNSFQINQNYSYLINSINYLNKQIQYQENIIFNLNQQIYNEFQNDLNKILYHINQTLSYSRLLTNLSNQFDQKIHLINQNIEKKQHILDDLELDWALQDNINIDNLNNHEEEEEEEKKDLFYFKNTSISQSSPLIIKKKHFSVENHPTIIVESIPSILKSNEYLSKNNILQSKLNQTQKQDKLFQKNNIEFLPFSIRNKSLSKIDNNNDESDTGISSIYSNDEQLITLV